MNPRSGPPRISVIAPLRNEALNVEPLTGEIEAALAASESYELLFVDDGSTDGTSDAVLRLRARYPWVRLLRHQTSCGQSAAVRTGVRAARAPIVVTLDGDGQNDPAFIPKLIQALATAGPVCGLVQGQRLRRRASGFKRLQSRIANGVRGAILSDGARDTGCGLKCFPREVYLALPFFDALHRFMPALVKREGYEVVFVDVIDRPRRAGASNYGLFDRLWIGLVDLAGVRWLIQRRKRQPVVTEADAP
jgi:glycosyltransferase involved in cell wall biosynthesis